MKEAFWGVLIIILGLFGIVVVNIFQNVTVDNDRVYYLIKESTEAAAYDALDLTYYRLSGDLRIVEDKFVENLTRRFAENVSMGDYTIYVEDVNEMPPKVSVRIRSGITSIQGDQFGIVNEVDGIIETKYNLNEVLDFLGIEEKDWNSNRNNTNSIGDVCNLGGLTQEDLECIPGDIMFTGFGEVFNIKNAVCNDETDKLPKNVERVANYKTCNCDGKWEEGSETIIANPVRNGSNYDYIWNFYKKGELRTIDEKTTKKVKVQVCTTGIGIMVPTDIEKTIPKEDNSSYEPSTDNSKYVICPTDGIRVPVDMKFTLHPNYIPEESVNRDLEWITNENNILSLSPNNPSKICSLNKEGTNCYSKAIVTAKNVGTTLINVKTTRGQTATCKVEVFDGTLDSLSCKDISVLIGKNAVIQYSYEPKNATKYDFEYSISDSSIAKLEGNTITGLKSGSSTVTIKDKKTGKVGTCNLLVATQTSSSSGSGGNGGYWIVVNDKGEVKSFSNEKDALNYSNTASDVGKTSNVYSVSGSGETTKTAETVLDRSSGSSETYTTTYADGTSKKVMETQSGIITVTYDKNGNEIGRENKPYNTPSTSGGSSGGGGSSSSSSSGGSSGGGNKGGSSSGGGNKGGSSSGGGNKGGSSSGGGNKGGSSGSSSSGSSSSGSSSGGGGCLVEGTKIKLANGKYKNIENITYNDLLEVWNFETGSYTYEYPIWIEKENRTSEYTNIEFSDGTNIKVAIDHGFYSLDKNMFINLSDLKIGSKIAKIINGKVEDVIVTKISKVRDEIKYYHVVSTRYYNVIANDLLTTDYIVLLSNFREFNDDLTWKTRNYSQNDLYSYDELNYLPYYLYKGFRAEEAKVFENVLNKNEFKEIMSSIILNTDRLSLPKSNLLGKRLWMVTTSDDSLNLVNEFKYLKEEGSIYKVPTPNVRKNFEGWYNTADGKYYKPNDLLTISTGTHLIAVYK